MTILRDFSDTPRCKALSDELSVGEKVSRWSSVVWDLAQELERELSNMPTGTRIPHPATGTAGVLSAGSSAGDNRDEAGPSSDQHPASPRGGRDLALVCVCGVRNDPRNPACVLCGRSPLEGARVERSPTLCLHCAQPQSFHRYDGALNRMFCPVLRADTGAVDHWADKGGFVPVMQVVPPVVDMHEVWYAVREGDDWKPWPKNAVPQAPRPEDAPFHSAGGGLVQWPMTGVHFQAIRFGGIASTWVWDTIKGWSARRDDAPKMERPRADAAYFVLAIAKARLLIDAVEGHNDDDNAILNETVQMLEDIERELAVPSGEGRL